MRSQDIDKPMKILADFCHVLIAFYFPLLVPSSQKWQPLLGSASPYIREREFILDFPLLTDDTLKNPLKPSLQKWLYILTSVGEFVSSL